MCIEFSFFFIICTVSVQGVEDDGGCCLCFLVLLFICKCWGVYFYVDWVV